jgi:Fe-S-cluster containining protein
LYLVAVAKFVAVDHSRFRRVERAVFIRRIVADCMTHACRDREPDRARLDACCQHGADVDVGERDAILARADDLRALLTPAARDAPWFTQRVERDDEFPSGRVVRTRKLGSGCVFLGHDGRGCAIHRAAVEGGWDFRGVKPHVCRLYPMTYGEDALLLSDDYPEYSCAYEPGSPTVYRHSRDTLADVFGADLVIALDATERAVIGAAPRRLPTVQP